MPRARSSVICLFLASSPSAVRCTIWTVVVDPIQCMPQTGSRTNIPQEGGKVAHPFWCDRDPPATVIRKVISSWVAATILHQRPGTILGSVALKETVFCVGEGRPFTLETPTRLGVSTKVIAIDRDGRSAVANTMSFTVRQAFDHDQPTKAFPNPIHVRSIAWEKSYFNTEKGKGRVADFAANYRHYVL